MEEGIRGWESFGTRVEEGMSERDHKEELKVGGSESRPWNMQNNLRVLVFLNF